MARKRLPSGERHAQIADIAAGLFAKKGFNGVTTREIARAARVNEAILFRHFPTKEAIYTEIIDRKIRLKPEMLDVDIDADAMDDAELFRLVARLFFQQIEEDNTFLRLMLFSALEDHKLADLFLKSRTSFVFDFLLKHVTKRVRSGAFRDIRPAVIVESFLGMFFHYFLSHKLFRIPKKFQVSKDEAIDNFVKIFMEGVMARR